MKKLFVLSSLLLCSSLMAAGTPRVDQLIGTYKGKYSVWGKCEVVVKQRKDHKEDLDITVNKYKRGKLDSHRGFYAKKEGLEAKLAASPYQYNTKVYRDSNFPTGEAYLYQCAMTWWLGGCSNPYTGYEFTIDNDGHFSEATSYYKKKRKDEYTCRDLKKVK